MQPQDQMICRQDLAKGSLSFSLASKLLPMGQRHAIHVLYAWCRHSDNTIDDLPANADASIKRRAVDRLRAETHAALTGQYDGGHYIFRSLQSLNHLYEIPRVYFDDLIDGMEMDIHKNRYQDWDQLLLYCYRVAGVVGLMFCHITGLRRPESMASAVHLGTAMQLTNIARDVAEDFAMGRIYLPQSALQSARISDQQLLQSPQSLWPVIEELLNTADDHYLKAHQGFIDLPGRSALAAMAAKNIYQAIGTRIRHQGSPYLSHRVYVPTHHKILLLMKSLGQILLQVPYRLRHPFRSVDRSLLSQA